MRFPINTFSHFSKRVAVLRQGVQVKRGGVAAPCPTGAADIAHVAGAATFVCIHGMAGEIPEISVVKDSRQSVTTEISQDAVEFWEYLT